VQVPPLSLPTFSLFLLFPFPCRCEEQKMHGKWDRRSKGKVWSKRGAGFASREKKSAHISLQQLDSTWYSEYVRHATLKLAQCRYRRTSDTSASIYSHCTSCTVFGVSNSTFTFHLNKVNNHSTVGLSMNTKKTKNMFRITSKVSSSLCWSIMYLFPKFIGNNFMSYLAKRQANKHR